MASAAQRAKEAFGSRLREIRLDAGLTGRQLADLTGFHFTKVSRVEHGAQGLSDADIRAWCSGCGAEDQIPGLIAQARAVDSMYREWKRQARSGLRRLQETIEPLYERTKLFRIHEHWSIPGLLQTAAYSTESMAYWASLLDLPDDRDAATAARLDRQRVLRSGNHRVPVPARRADTPHPHRHSRGHGRTTWCHDQPISGPCACACATSLDYPVGVPSAPRHHGRCLHDDHYHQTRSGISAIDCQSQRRSGPS